jgi:hypothetical protein
MHDWFQSGLRGITELLPHVSPDLSQLLRIVHEIKGTLLSNMQDGRLPKEDYNERIASL